MLKHYIYPDEIMSDGVDAFYKPGARTSQIALFDRDDLAHAIAVDNGNDGEFNTAFEADFEQGNHNASTINHFNDATMFGESAIINNNDAAARIDDESKDFTCGWFGCRPRFIQRLCSAPCLLVSMSLGAFCQGLFVSGFIPSSLTSIERRFQLSSQQLGLLISVYDIVNIILVLFVVFVGGRRHKVRWVAVGVILLCISAIVYALPHFTTDTYSYVKDDAGVTCSTNGTAAVSDDCKAGGNGSSLVNYYYVFIAASVLAAFGSIPLYTLGLTALDESISNKSYGLYFGIFYAASTLGPGCGYLLAGIFLVWFTELSIPEGVTLSPLDPGWVGAWWIGCVLSAGLLILTAIPLSLFPEELPGTAKIRSEKENQAHNSSGAEEMMRVGFGRNPKDFIKAIKYLTFNPTFTFTVLGGVGDALLINSFGAFLPKFYENQFGISASLATILTGVVVVTGGVVGTVTGGLIMRKFNLKVPGLLKLMFMCNLISGVTFFNTLWRCEPPTLAGVRVNYDGTQITSVANINVTHPCNSHCACAEDTYIPVCAVDGGTVEYLSPCHAGCTIEYDIGVYGGCGCLNETGTAVTDTTRYGACPAACGHPLYAFSAISIFLIIVNFTSVTPESNVLLRVIPETQRSMALGINSFIKRLLGAIPGPILFGAVIDGACLLWQDTCGERGSCWVYDNTTLAWRIVVIATVLKGVSCCFTMLALLMYKPIAGASDRGCGSNGEVYTSKPT